MVTVCKIYGYLVQTALKLANVNQEQENEGSIHAFQLVVQSY